MPDKIYLYIFILCGIWSQEITVTFADEETRESSDILVRQKRVLNHEPDADISTPIMNVPYIVRIRLNSQISCVASILSYYVVITSTLCATHEPSFYQVVSGKGHLDKGTVHNVLDIRRHFGNHPERSSDGIALFTVGPPFVYGLSTFYIKLHSAPILPGTLGTISGWGYNFRTATPGTCYPRSLRSIVVPIMAHQDCVNRYRPHIKISDKDICTYHMQKHCGHNDGGAPLVVDDHLVGVHLWTGLGRQQNDPHYPDVFALVQDFEYNQWISTNMQNIAEQYHRHHY